MNRITGYLYAKYRAFAPLTCLMSPRDDILSGWKRWRWLSRQRRLGRKIEPSVRIQGDVTGIDTRLLLSEGSFMDRGVTIWLGAEGSPKGLIRLGDRAYIGPYSYLGSAHHRLEIGEDTMIGAGCYLITENHVTTQKDIPYRKQGFVGGDVFIGSNVWLGCHVTILPGVSIGDHAIVGAGAVVTKNIPPGETWAGIPARKIG